MGRPRGLVLAALVGAAGVGHAVASDARQLAETAAANATVPAKQPVETAQPPPAAADQRPTLFSGQADKDIIAGCVFALISALALSAGIGGGGFFVPLLVLIVGFDVHAATALSQACLSGGAITATAYSMQARHPSGKGPLIDWNLLLITSPSLLLGTLIGSFLNKFTPDIGILILLDLVLFYAAYTTIKKAMKAWAKESAEIEGARSVEAKASQPADVEMRAGARAPPSTPAAAAGQFGDFGAGKATPATEQHPLGDIALFGATWLLVVVSTFVRGSKKTPGLVKSGSWEYWGLTLLTAAGLLALSVAGKRRVSQKSSKLAASAAEAGALLYDAATVHTLRMWSVAGGVMAALCGIGGGMIMGPILLEVGVIPQVQAATTGAMLLIMSTSTVIGYMVTGAAPFDYSMFFAFSTGVGALTGKVFLSALIKKFRRPSLVIFMLALLIIISMVMMTTTGVLKVLPAIMEKLKAREVGVQVA